jgi:hypothetical protein
MKCFGWYPGISNILVKAKHIEPLLWFDFIDNKPKRAAATYKQVVNS